MFSIILGAGLFKFWGMLLGVPVFVVIYTLLNRIVKRKLERSDLPLETDDYLNVERIDPITREIIMHPGTEKTSEKNASSQE